MRSAPRIVFSAGEPSGDLHAAGVLRELRRRVPGLRARGLGGRLLAEAGAGLDLDYGELALIGLGDIPARLRSLRAAQRLLGKALDEADLLVCVDYAGFNRPLARRARRRGVPVVYYICPKVWVWGAWRAAGLASLCELMLPILPFEVELWRSAGARTRFVGNPVLDYLPPPGRPGDTGLVAVLPGSRDGELRQLLPVLVGAAWRMRDRRPGLRFLLPSATDEIRRRTLERLRLIDGGGILEPVEGDFHQVLRGCGLALTASGTATLEVACLGVPQLIVYRVDPLTELFARAVIRTPWVGLPNLVAGREVAPELLQAALTPSSLARRALELLGSPAELRRQREEGLRVRELLGGPGAAARAAAAIHDLLEETR